MAMTGFCKGTSWVGTAELGVRNCGRGAGERGKPAARCGRSADSSSQGCRRGVSCRCSAAVGRHSVYAGTLYFKVPVCQIS